MSSSHDIPCPIEVKLIGESSKTIPEKLRTHCFMSSIVTIDGLFWVAQTPTMNTFNRRKTQDFYWGEIADFNRNFIRHPHSFDGNYKFLNNDGLQHTEEGSHNNFKGFRIYDLKHEQLYLMYTDNHVEKMYIDPFGKYILVKLVEDAKVFEYSITPSLSYKVCVQMSVEDPRHSYAICLYSDGRLCLDWILANDTSVLNKVALRLTPKTKCTISTDKKILINGKFVSNDNTLDVFHDSKSIRKWEIAINACIFNLGIPLAEQANHPDEMINKYLKPPMHFAQLAMMKSPTIRISNVAVQIICHYMMSYK